MGSHAQIFFERRKFELFFRNQRNQTGERRPLARKSSVLKTLDSVLGAFAASDRAQSSFIFRARLHRAHIRKFRKTFFLVVDAHDSSAADDCCGEVSRSNRGSFLVARSNAGGNRARGR
jgi:hypothetical protein